MRATRLLATTLLLMSCQRTDTAQQAESGIEEQSRQARAEIEPLITNWERWVAEGNIDSMATLLAENSHVLPPNQPAVAGRDAWLTTFRPMLAQGQWTEDIVTESVVAHGPLAVERGSYVLTFTPGPTAPPGAKAMSDTGKYLWHWHKVDGRWQLMEAAWNSNRPAQP